MTSKKTPATSKTSPQSKPLKRATTTRHITKRPAKKSALNDASGGFRKKSVQLKTARGRKNSSQRWLQRQLNDPYVQEAQSLGYRSRAAFKLIEINERFQLISKNSIIVDLGAAPGGWSQIAAKLIQEKKGSGFIFAIDLLEMDAINGVDFMQGDFLDSENQKKLHDQLPGPIDLVMSDMAAYTTGHAGTDHIRTRVLGEAAFEFARNNLKPGGDFVAKVFAGGTHLELLQELKSHFDSVKHFKPPASRKESPETYVVCQNFRGKKSRGPESKNSDLDANKTESSDSTLG